MSSISAHTSLGHAQTTDKIVGIIKSNDAHLSFNEKSWKKVYDYTRLRMIEIAYEKKVGAFCHPPNFKPSCHPPLVNILTSGSKPFGILSIN